MHLLTTKKYIEDLSAEIYKVPKHIKIICFQILNDEMMQELKPAIIHAINNGTTMEIYADAIFSHHNITAGFFPAVTKAAREKSARIKAHNLMLFNELRALGVEVHFINEPGLINKHLLPFAGRDHRKTIFIHHQSGENISYFGAANFGDYKTNDYMIKVSEPEIIKALEKTISYINDNKPENDLVFDCTSFCTILMDRGRPLRSIIYEEGIKLIKSAKKRLIYVSQLLPEPPILQHFISAAKSGVSVEIIIPAKEHPQVGSFPYSIAFRYAQLQTNRNNIALKHSSLGFTHAKVLLSDNIALVGSHNLSFMGILSGTVELSAEVTESQFVHEVEEFVESIR